MTCSLNDFLPSFVVIFKSMLLKNLNMEPLKLDPIVAMLFYILQLCPNHFRYVSDFLYYHMVFFYHPEIPKKRYFHIFFKINGEIYFCLIQNYCIIFCCILLFWFLKYLSSWNIWNMYLLIFCIILNTYCTGIMSGVYGFENHKFGWILAIFGHFWLQEKLGLI